MLSRRSLQGALTVLFTMVFALAACGRQSPADQAPDPPSWFVGEEDGTTPDPPEDTAPPQQQEATLKVGVSAFHPTTLVVKAGAAVRVENTGTEARTFTLDGVDWAVVEPGERKVVSIHLERGRYALSSLEDPWTTGTLVVT